MNKEAYSFFVVKGNGQELFLDISHDFHGLVFSLFAFEVGFLLK